MSVDNFFEEYRRKSETPKAKALSNLISAYYHAFMCSGPYEPIRCDEKLEKEISDTIKKTEDEYEKVKNDPE